MFARFPLLAALPRTARPPQPQARFRTETRFALFH
jgi:hypothetical protein